MKYTINNSVKLTIIEGESVLLNVDDGKYYGVDEVGTEILNLLENNEHISNIVNKIARIYNVEETKVAIDVKKFITKLNQLKLVHVHE
ncbi:PqqD family protein [Lysinibacillus pakistanensis]|uniref:PqqD family protein n=1 Tax=Lysinibacillus pakistanensis TaxID=759811 RepID=A0AAX3WUT9_9BACI|nr:PqqD family protein [Lysinibacillus pakistanensis]MDM5230077.1 PqqD family protein [Lysinibacillus pakistanensis]WHY45675.1 PqqD family protein [Lysinibacillus pakistanensis]WHY50683.1 PqqD family protein [Lysinibacillus pakistanensis]